MACARLFRRSPDERGRDHGYPARRAGADVAPGDESRAHADPECPPPRRPRWLHLGRQVLDLARDRRRRFGARGGIGCAGRRQGRPRAGPFQELRRDVLVDVCGISIGRGLGADQFPPDAGRGRLSRHRLRCQSVFVPRRFSRSCHGRGKPGARIHLADRRGRLRREVGERGDRRSCGRTDRKRGGRLRRPLLVLLHLRHHGALQGGGADPWPDGASWSPIISPT